MQTLRKAAELLAAAHTIDDLVPIAAAAGCSGTVSPLDSDTRRALGLGIEVIDVSIATGHGALRALLVEARTEHSLRDLLTRMATRLATRAPHVLWLLIAVQPHGSDIAIAAWTAERQPPRLSALLANRDRIVDSDAETLRALMTNAHESDVMTHARWVELLGRDALTRRFYNTLEKVVSCMADSTSVGTRDERAEIALLYTSRLIFLAFLEAKGWLAGDHAFLSRHFDACMERGGGFHRKVLLPLFFGTLNTPISRRSPQARQFGCIPFLNGGLFTCSAIERRHRRLSFSDESYGSLIHDLFAQYRFTACEESGSWSEAAVDPEMLGRAFESLMVARERRTTGAFFTPQPLVERVTTAGLERVMERAAGENAMKRFQRGFPFSPENAASIRASLEQITLLDPACGSGAFLVHALERISCMLRELGDHRPIATIRREVLTRSIFGVDLNPTAVWLCELRLWLSVVIESDDDAASVPPLPNLDHNIRVGDALGGHAFSDEPRSAPGGRVLRTLRQRYATATGARKESLARQLDRAERQRMLMSITSEIEVLQERRRDLVTVRRSRDLFGMRHVTTAAERATARDIRARIASLRASHRRIADGGSLPFSFPVHFGDVAARGGFDLVVGNPPWVRPHHVSRTARDAYRRAFFVARCATWGPGAAAAAAGSGFGGQIDLAALFVERSLQLLSPGASLALLLPVKLWRSLAGGGVRQLIDRDAELRRLDDYSHDRSTFDAAVYPSLLAATRRARPGDESPICVSASIYRAGEPPLVWSTDVDRIPFDDSPGSPWIVIPPDPRRAFDRLRAAGVPLASSVFGRPLLGAKCGCNDAFIVRVVSDDGSVSHVVARNGRSGIVESALLRPLRRGEGVTPWVANTPDEFIIWTHDDTGNALRSLPPHTSRWLTQWKHELSGRADARRSQRWWTLFRTDGARFDKPRVVWADMGRTPRATVAHAGDPCVPLNSCYVVRARDERDAFALAAFLNGPLAAAWLKLIAEPARGDYRRYLGWTMSLLPLPADWHRARESLAPLGERAMRGDEHPHEQDLLQASIDAFGLTRREVAPLVAWIDR